ncbi:MAG: hypothetical protein IKO94_09360 [Selenomonadaceae bacterium]|nr:hypothetical protein [Selenomonadaceae bacterium]
MIEFIRYPVSRYLQKGTYPYGRTCFHFHGIFGAALLLSAAIIASSDDPRKLPFFTPIDPICSMPKYKAKEAAKKIAKYVAIIGGFILIISLLGVLLCEG